MLFVQATTCFSSRRFSSARCSAFDVVLGALVGVTAISLCPIGIAQDVTTAPDTKVLARLGSSDITLADVNFLLGRTEKSPALSRVALNEAVRLFAVQRQALQAMRRVGLAAKPEETKSWIESNVLPKEASASTPEELFALISERHGITKDVYLEQVGFRLSWERYLSKHLTEKNLAKHFSNQKSRFDGTKFKVQMISAVVPVGKSPARDSALKELDEKGFEALLSMAAEQGWTTFEPTWVRGSGDIDPLAVDVILKIKQGEASSPFETTSGVHVLQLMEIEPGQKELSEVEGEVRLHMLVYLLEKMAKVGAKDLPLMAAGNS